MNYNRDTAATPITTTTPQQQQQHNNNSKTNNNNSNSNNTTTTATSQQQQREPWKLVQCASDLGRIKSAKNNRASVRIQSLATDVGTKSVGHPIFFSVRCGIEIQNAESHFDNCHGVIPSATIFPRFDANTHLLF